MGAGLRGCKDEAAGLDRPRAQQEVPMRRAGGDRERGGNREQGRAAIDQRPIEFGKAQVVANAEPQAAERRIDHRSEEHTSELQSLMRISYAAFCSKKKTKSPKT